MNRIPITWALSLKRSHGDVWHVVRTDCTARCDCRVRLCASSVTAQPTADGYRCRRCMTLSSMDDKP